MKEEGLDADLLDRIAADGAFGLSREALAELVDPARFTRRSAEQVDRFLERWVDPALERYGAGARTRLAAATVRV
jgi:adenylosuccinate lyase